jgi:hypothetical protein
MTIHDWAFYLKATSVILVAAAVCVLAIWCPGVDRGWLRMSVRISGIVLSLPTLLAILLLFALPRYTSVQTLRSPDGRLICYIKSGGSGATVDFNSITVRPAWRPVAKEVYFTLGGFDPGVRWNDSRTLEIRYPQGEQPEFCDGSQIGINVKCNAEPRAEFYPMSIQR